MAFLKAIIAFIVDIFSASKTKEADKSVESELIESVKLFMENKDFTVLEKRFVALFGDSSTWAKVLTKGRLNYIVFTASNGKLLTINDFIKEYSSNIPSIAAFILNSFK